MNVKLVWKEFGLVFLNLFFKPFFLLAKNRKFFTFPANQRLWCRRGNMEKLTVGEFQTVKFHCSFTTEKSCQDFCLLNCATFSHGCSYWRKLISFLCLRPFRCGWRPACWTFTSELKYCLLYSPFLGWWMCVNCILSPSFFLFGC